MCALKRARESRPLTGTRATLGLAVGRAEAGLRAFLLTNAFRSWFPGALGSPDPSSPTCTPLCNCSISPLPLPGHEMAVSTQTAPPWAVSPVQGWYTTGTG